MEVGTTATFDNKIHNDAIISHIYIYNIIFIDKGIKWIKMDYFGLKWIKLVD